MPKRNHTRELTDDDVRQVAMAVRRDLGATEVTCRLHYTDAGWCSVQVSAKAVIGGVETVRHTYRTYVTTRGPKLLQVIYQHYHSLYQIIDREQQGLPPPLGW